MSQRTIRCFALFAAVLPLVAGAAYAATNAEMEASIRAALVDKLGADAKTIHVAFFDGKAVLSGKVAQDSTQEIAKEVALYVQGVSRVENEIESANPRRVIGGGKMIDETKDTTVEAEVKSALHNEIGDHSKPLEVEACDGVVSVRGPVPDKARHDLAMAAAKKVGGVTKVIDLLRVAG